jgi:hypothetical protein
VLTLIPIVSAASLEFGHCRKLVDEYLEGKLALHIYLRVRHEVSNSKSRNLCIVFEKMPSSVRFFSN